MGSANLPNWPRRLSAELAAAYLGISKTTLLTGVGSRRYPEPMRDGKRVLWDRETLDEWVDAASGRDGRQKESAPRGWSTLC